MSSALLAEIYGTFLLTFVATITITLANDPATFPAAASLGLGFIGLATGLALLAGIASVSHISGAHFNPVVTVALAYSGSFPRKNVVPYIIAQAIGAVIAGFVQLGMVGIEAGKVKDLGITVPNAALPLPIFSALLAEIVGTMVLVVTIMGSTDPDSKLPWGSSAIGLSLAALIWSVGAVSGASLNPARSLGPAVASLVFDSTSLNSYWIYVVGPLLGALLAAELYRRMRVR
ncbi:MAG: aquaporin [Thaumarchaeota archaeon]|nr:aquaporin [Nitrososphaerota archaeon]